MKEEYRDLIWTAPQPGPDFRERVLGAFDREFGRAPWWRRWRVPFVPVAGTLVVTLVVLMLIGQAFPQSLTVFSSGFRIPYVVEWELTRYALDGSPSLESRITSFMNGGDQIFLGKIDTGKPFWNLFQGIGYAGRVMVLQMAPSLVIPKQTNERISYWRAYVDNGCVHSGSSTVLGHETVLGHSTTIVLSVFPVAPGSGRTTQWLAPDLGCFALKQINEELRNGSFATVLRVNAVKVTVNSTR